MEEPRLLEIQALEVHFPVTSGILRRVTGHVQAVNGIDFTIDKGEVVGLVGESGSGKSTAGRAAIGLIKPTAGRVTFLGQNLGALDSEQLLKIRTEIQMVFQDPFASLNPRKTVRETIGEALYIHGIVKNEEEENDHIAKILLSVGLLPEAMERYPHQFSGGQQQRICIGRAIALKPKLLICDEAVSALDVSIQAQILNLLIELRQNMQLSYLFISHDLSVVRHICDRVVVLYLGKIMETARTEELFCNPKHPYTQALLSAIPKKHPLEKKERMQLKGEIPSPLSPPSGCPFRTRCPFAQAECQETIPKKVIKDAKTGKEDHIYHCILD